MAHLNLFGNKGFGSDLPNCNTDTTYVASKEDEALDLVLETAKFLYEANPSLLFRAFETGGTFGGLTLTDSDKASIVQGMCDAQNFSTETRSAIHAISIVKFGGDNIG